MQDISHQSTGEPLTIANPTISDVFDAYLVEQHAKLSANDYDHCKAVIGLLGHSLDGYAYQSLDDDERALWEACQDAEGDQHKEFCEIFGPDHILPNIYEFLGYFMVRKVVADQVLLRAAGTVTQDLAKWMAEKEYATPEESWDAIQHGADAARDLPQAARLSNLLYDLSLGSFSQRDTDIQDQFDIVRVMPGKIWLKGFGDDSAVGPITLPVKATKLCRVGWTISCAIRKTGKKYVLVEAWGVYP